MIPIIVVSHGEMADGIQKTIQMIAGEQKNLHFLSLSEDNPDSFKGELSTIFDKYPKTQSKLVLADLLGGSPYLLTAELIIKEQANCQLISGVNLPMIIDSIFSRSNLQIEELVANVIEVGKTGIVHFKQFNEIKEDNEGI